MNYYIGQELTFPKVKITEKWRGVSGTKYYRTDVGVSFRTDELDKLCPLPAPRAAIEDYFPMVKHRPSKYEGMNDMEIDILLCVDKSCSSWGASGKDCPSIRYCKNGIRCEYVKRHRAEAIAALEAEDAAREGA